MSADVELINGDLPLVTRHIRGNDQTIQRVKIALQTDLAEYFLDRSEGFPFIAWKEDRVAPIEEITNSVRERVERVPGVLRVEDVTGQQTDNRAVIIGFTVVLPDDDATTLFLDLFGNGTGATGVESDQAAGLPFVGEASSPPPLTGNVSRTFVTIFPPSGSINNAGGNGGSGGLE